MVEVPPSIACRLVITARTRFGRFIASLPACRTGFFLSLEPVPGFGMNRNRTELKRR